MISSSGAAMGVMEMVGLGVGFCLTLALWSLLAGNRAVARLAQHLLVGAALGYVTVLVGREILVPRLLTPLWPDLLLTPWIGLPLGLGLLLWAGGGEAILRQAQPLQPAPTGWRRWLRWAGLLPVSLLVGVGLAVGLIGVIQGSLLPQIWRTIGTGIAWSAPPAALLSSVLTLLVTTATLLALSVGSADRLLARTALFHPLLAGWIGFGKRALWLAAGALLARLAASYLSLLIGQMYYLSTVLQQLGLGSLADRFGL